MSEKSLTVREFNFHGDVLLTAHHKGKPVVALRRVVECLGLDWAAQTVRLRNDPVLAGNCWDITTVAEDGRSRSMMVMPLDKLNGWLFRINPQKVRGDLRDKLIRYQSECFDALNAYWTEGVAVNPAAALSDDDFRRLGGIIKSVVSRQIADLLPSLVAAELERDPRHVAVGYVPALQVLVDHNVPQKGRGKLSRRISARLRRFCISMGFTVRESRETRRYLYPPEGVTAWLAHEGASIIKDHLARISGQGVLKLVPRQ